MDPRSGPGAAGTCNWVKSDISTHSTGTGARCCAGGERVVCYGVDRPDFTQLGALMVEISVVIAARNAARTLPHQLRALAAQRPDAAWEVLVADNGSSDDTARVVREARGWLPGLRCVDASAVRGAGAARNAAVAEARGRSLLFCDADDVVAPGWADALHRALAGAALVAGRLEWARLNTDADQASRALPQQRGLQYSEPLPWLPAASSSNLGVRRDVFDGLGGFDPAARFLQDTDLCWRAQLGGERLAFQPEAVVHMRLRQGVRGAWRQGRNSGMGQRWLAARFGAARDLLAREVGEAEAAPPPRARRAWPARVARRAVLVGGDLLRLRGRGDVARLSWTTGFGIGYALGGLPDPDPFPTDAVALAAIPAH